MENYLFNKDFLIDILYKDAKDKNSSHDFGKDILPKIFNTSRVYAYDLLRNRIPGISKKEIGYWRDVGTIKAFWEANMDLRSVKPEFNLYNKKWPIRTASYGNPSGKICFQ
jgi:glucose-1-phosphate adenylyltransferase